MATIAVTSPSGDLQTTQDQEATNQGFPAWTAWERVLFRVATIFVIQLTVPFRAQFYQRLFPLHSLRDVYSIAGASGGISYITPIGESGRWGVGGFVNWGIALLVAIALGGIWTFFARNSKRKEYTVAYYWLRLLTRYWVALNILHYAYIKIYPSQMPYPSISNLHTLVGETAPYRYYWAIIGLSTWYQILLGCIEGIAGSLLFFRRTTAIGALLNLGMLYNVAYANFAYDGGVHLLSAEISLLAGFLLIPYIPNLYRLLVKKEDVVPDHYRPIFKLKWQRYAFTGFKYVAWTLFIPLYLYSDIHHFRYTNQSKEPRAPGLAGAKGYYNVTEFKLDGQDIPYSPLDPVRWHDVVFEDYPTLTYKVDKALPIRLENGGQGISDAEKRYELAGFAGGRTYLHYDIDEANQTLTVQDKNSDAGTRDANNGLRAPALLDRFLKGGASNATAAPDISAAGQPASATPGRGRGGRGGFGRGGRRQGGVRKLVWHFTRPSDSRIILTGKTFDNHEFYAVLDRIDDTQAIHIDSPIQGDPLDYARQFGRRYPVTPRSFDGTTDSPSRVQD